MSYCTSDILLLAGQIYTGLSSPSSQSIGYISGWLTAPENIGDLNNRLSTDMALTGSAPCIDGMGPEEATIYRNMYEMDYYETQALAVLAGGGSFWRSMAEGDSKISRDSMLDLSKTYMTLQQNSEETLYVRVSNYKRRLSIPATVVGTDLPAYPSP